MYVTDEDFTYEYSVGEVVKSQGTSSAITSSGTNTEFWTDINSMAADDESNGGSVFYALSKDDRTSWQVIKDTVSNETENLAVTVATGDLYEGGGATGNVFYIEGNGNPPLGLTRGNTYIFDQSDASNSGHPLAFQLTDGTSYTDGITVNGTPGNSGANVTFVVPSDAPDNLEYYCTVHGLGMGGPVAVKDLSNTRSIAREDSGEWQINTASGYLTEIWVAAAENNEFYSLEDASSNSQNQMDSGQLGSVSDQNHYELGDSLYLGIIMSLPNGDDVSPTSDGVSINFDGNTKDVGAILGQDYEWEVPDTDVVQVKALSPENFKIRVL